MAFDLRKEEDVQDYLKNVETQYKFGCHQEKNPEACHLLGDFMEAIKKDYVAAGKSYKLACDDLNFGRSCHVFGNYLMLGRGVEKENQLEAYRYYSKACEQDHPDGCCHSGLLLISDDPKISFIQSVPRGLATLDKACELKSSQACYFLSGFYLTGSKDKSIEKDMTRAARYSQKACDLDNIYACANLSLMYKKGEGVEKNMELSEQMKKKAVELQHQHNDQLLLNFQRGPNT